MKKIIFIGLGRMGLAHLKSFLNKPISNLELTLKSFKQVSFLKSLEPNGNTSVTFTVLDNKKKIIYKLSNNRKVDRNTINLLKKEGIQAQIN